MLRRRSAKRRKSSVTSLVAVFVLLGAIGSAAAEGPVDPLNLPGGVAVTDSDPGNGEQWARASGRNFNFAVGDLARFSALGWGIHDGSVPGAAFDNNIDGSRLTTEYLSFNGAESNLANGVARWVGAAEITLVAAQAGVYELPTRVTLTVTDHVYAPLPLAMVADEVDPGIDIKNDTVGTFNVNLLFEVQYSLAIPAGSMIGPGDDAWYPLLDLFDLLDTGVAQDGYAHTQVSTGFYYTLAGPGLTLEQHDQTVHEVLAEIENDTDYLQIEVPARLIGIDNRLLTFSEQVLGVEGAVAAVDAIIRAASANVLPYLATRDDVRDASRDLGESFSELLLMALGILPLGGTFPDDIDFGKVPLSGVAEQNSVDAMQADVEMLQADVDELAAHVMEHFGADLRVEVVEIADPGNQRYRQWLVKTTRNGSLVDADLIGLLAIRGAAGEPPTVEELSALADVRPLTTGLQEVFLEVGQGRDETRAYQFEFSLDGEHPAEGSALVP
jgi:hypothetical protein